MVNKNKRMNTKYDRVLYSQFMSSCSHSKTFTKEFGCRQWLHYLHHHDHHHHHHRRRCYQHHCWRFHSFATFHYKANGNGDDDGDIFSTPFYVYFKWISKLMGKFCRIDFNFLQISQTHCVRISMQCVHVLELSCAYCHMNVCIYIYISSNVCRRRISDFVFISSFCAAVARATCIFYCSCSHVAH